MRTHGVAFALVLTAFASASLADETASPPGASSAAPPTSATAVPKAPGSKAATPKAETTKQTPSADPTPSKATTKPGAPKPGAPNGVGPLPVPASSAAPAGSTAPAPAGTDANAPPAPDTSAPPLYYVEPSGRSAEPEGAPGEEQGPVYEPPPPMYVYEPPPPPNVSRRAPPKNSFWVGVRVGAMIPFGSVWTDGFNGYYRQRTFRDYASPGPVFELDVGARLARHYNVFAMWEHASLGTGSLDAGSFGGQERGATNLYGVGVRFSTDPTNVGFLMEIGLGYRDFRAYWNDGTKLSLTDGWLDAHIGLGVDIRINRWLSLSPMIVLSGGSFDSAHWSGRGGSGDALTPYDQDGEYGTLVFQLGGHADVF